MMHSKSARNLRSEDRGFKEYFRGEIEQIHVPEPPAVTKAGVENPVLIRNLRRVFAAIVTVAAMTLLILTSTHRTPLAGAVEETLDKYDLQAGITGFIIEAGKVYRLMYERSN